MKTKIKRYKIKNSNCSPFSVVQWVAVYVFSGFLNQSILAQSPILSYATPQIYAVNSPITTLVPLNAGGAIYAPYQVITHAGSGVQGSSNGLGNAAAFYNATNVVLDAAGNQFVADYLNNKIRKISPSGVVTDFAGSGAAGAADGNGTAATFNYPGGIATDANGNLYVTDCLNNKIRKISTSGEVTTLAGNGLQGDADGSGSTASFFNPTGLAVDQIGNVYVADCYNNKIRKITPSGVVSTIAGIGTPGAIDGNGSSASFNYPTGLAIDAFGTLFVTDFLNNKIRKITNTNVVSTFAGNITPGNSNGTGSSARFNKPKGIGIDAAGTLYVADCGNQKIRKITLAGLVSDLAGTGTFGATDGGIDTATFNAPSGVSADASSNIYVADYENSKIRKISPSGYTISPNLPAGLMFNETTGVISGTPTVATNETTYTVTGYNSYGSFSATIRIIICNFILSPAVTISASATSICKGTPVTFTATLVNGGTSPIIQWKKNGTIVGTNSVLYTDNSLVNNDVISCEIISNDNCASRTAPASDAVSITVFTTLPPSGSNTQEFCSAAVVSDLVVVGTGIKWYSTSVGVNIPLGTNNLLSNGAYYATQTMNNCESNRTNVFVKINTSKKPYFNINQTLCAGIKPPLLKTTSLNGVSGTWSPPLIDNSASGTYTFTPNANECAVPITIDITINQLTLVSVEYIISDAFNENQTITILASNAGDYTYQLDSENPQTANFFENVTSGLHTITVYDQNGCSKPIKKSDLLILKYPKFFTPNGDSYNDTWTIAGLRNIPTAKIQIYDRYGKLLKDLNKKERSWDGNFNGLELPSDDYWFVVEYTEKNSSKIFKSHFALKR